MDMDIQIISDKNLIKQCNAMANKHYISRYNVSLGHEININDKKEPYPDEYFVLFIKNKIAGFCGVYKDIRKIFRFDGDMMGKTTGVIELTKLVIIDKFRGRNFALILTMVSIIHYLSRGINIVFHSGKNFIEKVLDKIKIKYKIEKYNDVNSIYKMYPHNELYRIEISNNHSKL